MNVHAFLALMLCAVSVARAACECYPDCECEPLCHCCGVEESAWQGEMQEACANGDAATVKRLLAEGADPNAAIPCDSIGEPVSLLYLAVEGLHTECVQFCWPVPVLMLTGGVPSHAPPPCI